MIVQGEFGAHPRVIPLQRFNFSTLQPPAWAQPLNCPHPTSRRLFKTGGNSHLRLHVEGQDLPRIALGEDFKRTAADLAVGGKPLLGNGGVDRQLHRLPAIRALDAFTLLHRLRTLDFRLGTSDSGISRPQAFQPRRYSRRRRGVASRAPLVKRNFGPSQTNGTPARMATLPNRMVSVRSEL